MKSVYHVLHVYIVLCFSVGPLFLVEELDGVGVGGSEGF